MELKEFLDKNPLIVKSNLAREMYPNIGSQSAVVKLKNKLDKIESGSGIQRMLPDDIMASKLVLKKLRDNIDEYLEEK